MWPKIRDVAREARVSLATVSRVINNTKAVAPELRARVLEAVDRLGYQPNQHARWLSSRKSNVIGLIMPSVDDSNRGTYLQACTAALRAHGFEVIVGLTDGDRELEEELASAYAQSHASGIILTTHRRSRALQRFLADANIPVLFAWAEDFVGRKPTIRFDTAAAAEALVSSLDLERLFPPNRAHFAAGEHRAPVEDATVGPQPAGMPAAHPDVWILAGDTTGEEVTARARALRAALEAVGITEVTVIETDGTTASACAAVLEREVEQPKVSPGTAGTDTGASSGISSVPRLICCTSDYLAIGARRAVHEHGLRVPDDVAITGFGETVYAAACTPELTTVKLDSADLGRLTGESMVRVVNGESVPDVQHVGHGVVRGGSCPLKVGAWQP